ncbi:hypothetical protein AC1031_009890 [Aphanomyces cochlioides]|nr:hypothetical protein AC1031_009890 [Aphanomyces cochlioides]
MGTKARNFKNKVDVTAALDGLKRFEVRDTTSCNAKKTYDNCKGIIGKLFVGGAATGTTATLTIAKAAGAAVGVGPVIVGLVGASASGLNYYCNVVKDLCYDLREFDSKFDKMLPDLHNKLERMRTDKPKLVV